MVDTWSTLFNYASDLFGPTLQIEMLRMCNKTQKVEDSEGLTLGTQ